MQPLDDIAALAQLPQALLRIGRQHPACGPGRFSQTQPLQGSHSANSYLPQRVTHGIAARPEINNPVRRPRFPRKHPIDPGPAFGRRLRLEALAGFELRSRAELAGDEIAGAGTKAR